MKALQACAFVVIVGCTAYNLWKILVPRTVDPPSNYNICICPKCPEKPPAADEAVKQPQWITQ